MHRHRNHVTESDLVEVFALWCGQPHSATVLTRLSALPNVSLIERRGGHCRIVRHAPRSIEAGGENLTGADMADIRTPLYGAAFRRDCERALSTGRMVYGDVAWADERTSAGAVFSRLLLPFGDVVISATDIRDTNFEGALPRRVQRLDALQ